MNTFMVVTFAWSFALAFWWISRLWRCKHDWEPVVERELPSKAEVLKASGEDISTWRNLEKLKEIAQKTFFAIISCKKCGAVKEFKVVT